MSWRVAGTSTSGAGPPAQVANIPPRQPYPQPVYDQPMLYTALPITCPTAVNPIERSAANSSTDSPDVKVLLCRCEEMRHCADSGSRPAAISAALACAYCSGVSGAVMVP